MKNAYECVKAFSETDFTEDLKRSACRTLFMHGEDDQIVPARLAKKAVRVGQARQGTYYPGAPHGLTATMQDRINWTRPPDHSGIFAGLRKASPRLAHLPNPCCFREICHVCY